MNTLMKKNALVFGGQGSQFVGMGKMIYNMFPETQKIFVLASEIVGYDVAKMCFEASQEDLNKTVYCQVCTLAVELAIYDIFKSCGIPIDAVAGFSLGEYAALVVSKSIDMRTAFSLVNLRAISMEEEIEDHKGTMVALVNLSIEQVNCICQKYGTDRIAISGYNAFNQVIVSVNKTIISEVVRDAKVLNGRVIPLNVCRPFHHPMMKPAADKFLTTLQSVTFNSPIIPIYMNVTGERLFPGDNLVTQLYNQMIQPVQWITTIQNMVCQGINTFWEISPRMVLAPFIKNIVSSQTHVIDVHKLLNT